MPNLSTLRWFLLAVLAGVIGGIAYDELKKRGWYRAVNN